MSIHEIEQRLVAAQMRFEQARQDVPATPFVTALLADDLDEHSLRAVAFREVLPHIPGRQRVVSMLS